MDRFAGHSSPKLAKGDRVAVVSPSFAAPARWPHIYELGLERLRETFGLEPVVFPTTCELGASKEDRARDLVAAFEDPSIKAVISTLGGDDQVTYVRNLPDEPFRSNPKPFFGYSDNTHLMNHLWLNGVPSFYGGALFTEFAQTPRIDPYTEGYLRHALFGGGEVVLEASPRFNDVGVSWDDPANFTTEKVFEKNPGWQWDGDEDAKGITWGGCVESIDDLLRCEVCIPSLEQFESVVLLLETSEEVPRHEYVRRVIRALGERGILAQVRAVLVGRPKAWEFDRQRSVERKVQYREDQRKTVLSAVRAYNLKAPVVQNLDFGHTNPTCCMPYGGAVRLVSSRKEIFATY